MSDNDTYTKVCTGLKSTLIYRTVLKSPLKLNLPSKVLEKHSDLEKPLNLTIYRGFSTVFGDLNQYKIVMPLLGAAYLHQIRASQFYNNFLIIKSLVMQSSISEVEF